AQRLALRPLLLIQRTTTNIISLAHLLEARHLLVGETDARLRDLPKLLSDALLHGLTLRARTKAGRLARHRLAWKSRPRRAWTRVILCAESGNCRDGERRGNTGNK
ncbi:MAG TPA: hypothetical protein VF929_11530, partial [Gemmatimonadaceae bacterium]